MPAGDHVDGFADLAEPRLTAPVVTALFYGITGLAVDDVVHLLDENNLSRREPDGYFVELWSAKQFRNDRFVHGRVQVQHRAARNPIM